MKCIKNFRLATQGITAVMLFGIAFAAGADQMMRVLPAPTLPAVQQIAVPAAVQPVTPMSQMKRMPADSPASVKRPVVGGFSEATKARLKAAGLDAADPSLTTKLQAKLLSSGASFRSAHMSSIKIVPKLPGVSKVQSMGGAPAVASALAPKQGAGSGDRISAPLLPGVATIEGLYFVDGERVTQFEPYNRSPWALVSSTEDLKFNFLDSAEVTIVTPCGVSHATQKTVYNGVYVASPNGSYSMNLKVMPRAAGKSYYYVDLGVGGFSVGASPRNVTVSVKFANLGWSSITLPAQSQPVTTAITLTIDASPPFMTSNKYGVGASNGLFGNPGAARLDPGTNPSASTSGDDVVGLTVNLGPGWSVTSTKIIAAHSGLDAQNDNTPDNAYRGATITQQPSSNRLQTTVHWHYGVAESLSYTIEWQLQGPGGQRPLMTMPLGGPCDS